MGQRQTRHRRILRYLLIYLPRDPNVTYYIVGDRIVAVRNGTIIDVLSNIFR